LESKAVITDFGWVVEMRIPYAALRFSVKKKNLGLEFFREIRRDRQNTPGILLIQKIGSFTQQTGTLEGMKT
jgi:hypothetical protein